MNARSDIDKEISQLLEKAMNSHDFYKIAVCSRALCGFVPYQVAARLTKKTWDIVSKMNEDAARVECRAWISQEEESYDIAIS